MNFKFPVLVLIAFLLSSNTIAQAKKADSTGVAQTFHELLKICRSVDFGDPKVSELGLFYKAAPYIIYRGDEKVRKWKDFANYNKAEDKKGVNEVCERINQTVNQDSLGYRIIKYHTEIESEGTWHVLLVRYTRKEKERTTSFAFLKVRNKFGLGDID